jgi:hypothetical protein
MMNRGYFFILFFGQDLQDYQDYFLRHFPEESGENQSACGGKNNYN